MFEKFLIYGALGWCLEVIFTGVASALARDRAATSTTYLWMLPIYGATALILESVQDVIAPAPWVLRGIVYVSIIYAAEFSSGWGLERLLGRCPWDYGSRGLNVRGLIRLDYAPAWFAVGLIFEPVRHVVAGLAQAPTLIEVAGRLLAVG